MSGHIPLPNRYTAFLSKVDTKGFDHLECWSWLGAGKGNGYGNVTFNGKNKPAHRHAYELFIGSIPDGMDVCHSCDNRWCVNPDHLWIGTREDNMRDCLNKGRADGGNRKRLPERAIQEIRRQINIGTPSSRIARIFDVNQGTIHAIKYGKSYVER